MVQITDEEKMRIRICLDQLRILKLINYERYLLIERSLEDLIYI